MSAVLVAVPKFRKEQFVQFIGGTGIIHNYKPESGVWSYLVEMEMGPAPDMGRVGYETMLWLPETDIAPLEDQENQYFNSPAVA